MKNKATKENLKNQPRTAAAAAASNLISAVIVKFSSMENDSWHKKENPRGFLISRQIKVPRVGKFSLKKAVGDVIKVSRIER